MANDQFSSYNLQNYMNSARLLGNGLAEKHARIILNSNQLSSVQHQPSVQVTNEKLSPLQNQDIIYVNSHSQAKDNLANHQILGSSSQIVSAPYSSATQQDLHSSNLNINSAAITRSLDESKREFSINQPVLAPLKYNVFVTKQVPYSQQNQITQSERIISTAPSMAPVHPVSTVLQYKPIATVPINPIPAPSPPVITSPVPVPSPPIIKPIPIPSPPPAPPSIPFIYFTPSTTPYFQYPTISTGQNIPISPTFIQTTSTGISKTPNVFQPVPKITTYEIRRPAVQKQFYDIEQRIIVRPAGTYILESHPPVSKVAKLETLHPSAITYAQQQSDKYTQQGHSNSETGHSSAVASSKYLINAVQVMIFHSKFLNTHIFRFNYNTQSPAAE